ncbi:hypothetical protein RP20_CCG022251 [Aedes albopictus]|nr:hypothetical protein RP20_CCG022251 [Aedes albopictus]
MQVKSEAGKPVRKRAIRVPFGTEGGQSVAIQMTTTPPSESNHHRRSSFVIPIRAASTTRGTCIAWYFNVEPYPKTLLLLLEPQQLHQHSGKS